MVFGDQTRCPSRLLPTDRRELARKVQTVSEIARVSAKAGNINRSEQYGLFKKHNWTASSKR